MTLAKKYDPKETEPRLEAKWRTSQIYAFDRGGAGEVFSIDTPPPTVSGYLHLGHAYSYSHTDMLARFWRMQGKRVFYPMGFDDNGLPTERFVAKKFDIRPENMTRGEFTDLCLRIGEEMGHEYRLLWQRLGFSVDWNYSYRTIDAQSRKISQWSFIDLYKKGLAYQKEAPAIWCTECQASFAQADLNDMEQESEYIHLPFEFDGGGYMVIATTRPEFLAACVAIFVHPADARFTETAGKHARVPFYGQYVPVLTDPGVDTEKGTGAVMCCTFGDSVDVTWWHAHGLDRVDLITRDGRMKENAGPLTGLTILEARKQIKLILEQQGLILQRQPSLHMIRVHERCDTPVEYLMVKQWFIRLLEHKGELAALGEQLRWYPAYMKNRYQAWVENLNWDWCITRQRQFGVPFPVWHCRDCGNVILAEESELPVDPVTQAPNKACEQCGGHDFQPEMDMFDTWATSSMSPQIVGQWQEDSMLYQQVYPFTMRAQAHDIIRTWAFYTLVKSFYHYGRLPWQDVAISGWGIAGEGMGKISKSRGGGPMTPMEMIDRYSADAVRYWAACTSPGKDAVISEEKIQAGMRLTTKLWNVARFAERFISEETTGDMPDLSSADRWILARMEQVNQEATKSFKEFDYASAKNAVESFFWHELADNYLEMCKLRLYGSDLRKRSGAVFTLRRVFDTVLKLLAPFMPYITEEIYQGLSLGGKEVESIHLSDWPNPDPAFKDSKAEEQGKTLIAIATVVRRYKSQRNLPVGFQLSRLQLATMDTSSLEFLENALDDLTSITRADQIDFVNEISPDLESVELDGNLKLGILETFNSPDVH
jgi:valyl-tRNA synthetase